MKFVQVMLVGVVAALVTGGCNKGSAAAGPAPSPFDKRWDSLQQQGAQAIRIVDEPGTALMDNVLGAQAGALAMAPWMAESLKNAKAGSLPDQPNPEDVQKLVRQYVPGVKSCYQRLTRSGDMRTGKAIVSFQIGADGHVAGLNIDAPAFDGSQLVGCIDSQVSHWVFPPSRNGISSSSYPFVFVGS
jgi:hypothetical protein